MSLDITSANSVFTLSIPGLGIPPFTVEGYAVDDAFSTDEVASAETMMGVDGKMSAGATPFITPLKVMLQANSPSISVFETWLAAGRTRIFVAQASILLPAVSKLYAFQNGVLSKIKQLPDAKKVLQPQSFNIDWERVTAAPIG